MSGSEDSEFETAERDESRFDRALDALGHVQRRRILLKLLERESDDQPLLILGRETQGSDPLVSLHHVHLPRLAAHGYVEWHRDPYEVEKGPNFEEIEPLLELLDSHRERLPAGWLST